MGQSAITRFAMLAFLYSGHSVGHCTYGKRGNRDLRFVTESFDTREQMFRYYPVKGTPAKAMNGAGIIALTRGGRFDYGLAQKAGDWLLARPYRDYSMVHDGKIWFHYGLFYTVPAMYLLSPLAAILSHNGRHDDSPSECRRILAAQRR